MCRECHPRRLEMKQKCKALLSHSVEELRPYVSANLKAEAHRCDEPDRGRNRSKSTAETGPLLLGSSMSFSFSASLLSGSGGIWPWIIASNKGRCRRHSQTERSAVGQRRRCVPAGPGCLGSGMSRTD